MILTFNTNGNDKQKECARLWMCDLITDIVYGGSKGSGKSYLGINLIFGDAFTYPETYYFIARKKLNDLVKYTLPSIYEVFKHWGVDESYYTFNATHNYFELYNKSRVYLLQAKYEPSDPDYARFGSMQMTRGWIEEAGEFPLLAKTSLQASIGRWNNRVYVNDKGEYSNIKVDDTYTLAWDLKPKLLQTCNPAKNYLYSQYYKPAKEGALDDYKGFVQALPNDNKMLPPDYVANLRRILTPNQIRRLLLGEWEYDDNPNQLCEWDAILDAFTNDFIAEDHTRKGISSDIATRGRDRFITTSWLGNVARIALDIPVTDSKRIEISLRQLIQETGTPRSRIIGDSDGIGDFLGSYLKGIFEFHGNATSTKPILYKNLKTECAYKLAELINARQLRIVCTPEVEDRIKDELALLIGVDATDSSIRRELISKDKQKELNGGKSPDYLDSLIMGMILFIQIKKSGRGVKASYSRAS